MRYCIMESEEREKFLEITQTKDYSFSNVAGDRTFTCHNHNAFLSMMEGALSGKTGFLLRKRDIVMSVRCAGMDVHLSYLCLLAGGQITKTINGKIHADLWNMGWNITIIRRWRKKWRRSVRVLEARDERWPFLPQFCSLSGSDRIQRF